MGGFTDEYEGAVDVGLYFQDDFWEAISSLPTCDRDACAGALLALYFDGEEDTRLQGTARGFYIAFRQRILIAKARAIAGSKGGKKRSRKLKPDEIKDALKQGAPSASEVVEHCPTLKANGEATTAADSKAKRKQTAEQTHKQSAKQTTKKNDKRTRSISIKSERESEGEKEDEIPPATFPEAENTIHTARGINGPSNHAFGLRCLKALNDVLGTAYGQLPPTCTRFLAGMEGRYTDEQVHRMIEYKRDEWQGKAIMRKHLTAATLFSPDHFESYMHQAMQEGGDRWNI